VTLFVTIGRDFTIPKYQPTNPNAENDDDDDDDDPNTNGVAGISTALASLLKKLDHLE